MKTLGIRRELAPDGEYGSGTLTPFILGGCAAWLHLPPEGAPRRTRGAVLCPALGYDERCLRRPMRLLGDALARRGIATLRFDFPGTGDSMDLPAGADAVAAWSEALRGAGVWLKRELGLEELALGGFRFGGLLAAAEAGNAERLVLLAPIPSGKSWLNRVRFAAAQGAAASRTGPRPQSGGAEPGRGPGPTSGREPGLDADGVLLSEASCRSLAGLDLTAPGPPLPPTLLVSGPGSSRALGEALERRSRRLDRAPFPGFDRLLIGASDNDISADVLEAASAFMAEDARLAPERSRAPEALGRTLEGPGWREVLIEPEPGLHGTLTRPAAPTEAAGACRGVLFLNAGGDPKAGVGRFAALASRALAAEGHIALRLDFRGVGDSREPEGVARTHPYLTPRTGEIRAGVRQLRDAGAQEVFLVGISAGGYQALHGALQIGEVAGAFCISTLKFVWRPGDGVVIGSKRWGRPLGAYARDLLSPRAWRRILAGEVRVGWILRSLLARLVGLLEAEGRRPESRALVEGLRALSARGGRIGLLMGTEDAAFEEVEAHFGPGGARFAELAGMSLEVRPGLDHGLVYARSRADALRSLLAFLESEAAAG